MSAEKISYELKRFAGIQRDYKPEEVEILKSLETQIKSTLSQELFRIMVSDVQKSRGITVDESAINAVHVNFQ